MAEEFEKAVNKAIAWLAAEYKYTKELKKDLEELKRDLAEAKKKEEVKDIKNALRDFRYIGKCERRLARHERVVEEGLAALEANVSLPTGSLGEIKEVTERIKLEASDLIKNASLREGHIRDNLLAVKEAVEKGKLEEAKEKIEETEKADDDSLKWIAALSSDLSLARRYHGSFIKEHAEGMSIEQIKEKIAHLTPESQISYLGDILSRKGLLAKKTTENVKALIWEIAESVMLWDEAAKAYEKTGEWKLVGDVWMRKGYPDYAAEAYIKGGMEKAKAWKIVGDAWIKGAYPHKAAEAYIKGGMEKAKAWKLIGDAWMKRAYPEEAAEAYEEAGEWKLAGNAWNKAGEGEKANKAYQKAKAAGQI